MRYQTSLLCCMSIQIKSRSACLWGSAVATSSHWEIFPTIWLMAMYFKLLKIKLKQIFVRNLSPSSMSSWLMEVDIFPSLSGNPIPLAASSKCNTMKMLWKERSKDRHTVIKFTMLQPRFHLKWNMSPLSMHALEPLVYGLVFSFRMTLMNQLNWRS